MKAFYLTAKFDLHLLCEILLLLNKKEHILLRAIEGVSVTSLSRADYTDLSTREDAELLFLIEADTAMDAVAILSSIRRELAEGDE